MNTNKQLQFLPQVGCCLRTRRLNWAAEKALERHFQVDSTFDSSALSTAATSVSTVRDYANANEKLKSVVF